MDLTRLTELPWNELALKHIGLVVYLYDPDAPAEWQIGTIDGISSENRGRWWQVSLTSGALSDRSRAARCIFDGIADGLAHECGPSSLR